MHEQKPAVEAIVPELKAVSHDVFNLMTVMYGLQETLQGLGVEEDGYTRALADFNQVVAKMQQIGDRLLKLYRDQGGAAAPAAKAATAKNV